MQAIHLTAPFDSQVLKTLHAGDSVLVSGVIYTARDAAHGRMVQALKAGQPLPVDLRGQCVFYAGPTPTPPGKACGAIGPTTSVRMDPYTPTLLRCGVNALIGKGDRGDAVISALKETGGVYFAAAGGCAAVLCASVESVQVLAYEDLGTESVKRLIVKDLPLTVAVDSQGNDLYRMGRRSPDPE